MPVIQKIVSEEEGHYNFYFSDFSFMETVFEILILVKRLSKGKVMEDMDESIKRSSKYPFSEGILDRTGEAFSIEIPESEKKKFVQCLRRKSYLKSSTKNVDEIALPVIIGEAIYEITANAAGVISSINAVAGNTTVPDETLMTIDQTDRGFTLSFSVTTDQSRKVQVGDKAEVTTSNWWFDGVIDATLTAISTNPSDPKNSKILNFTITGEVATGDQLTLSIGERSQNYELIVPKSALRTDSNGKYVLILEQKPSALSTRYYATRVDVQEIASDDTQSAVSGGLSSGEFVITSSSHPIEAGDQVRLAEN